MFVMTLTSIARNFSVSVTAKRNSHTAASRAGRLSRRAQITHTRTEVLNAPGFPCDLSGRIRAVYRLLKRGPFLERSSEGPHERLMLT